MIEITNEDIDSIETILLPYGGKFEDDHRMVIRNLETVDIKACPGSGKTTTLIAKLLILEKKLPFINNQGICVLTHTNVGVNEIKERSSSQEASKLFQYPNHVSTIQIFVNKYLAIPSYKHFYNNNVYSIDQETYGENFHRAFLKIPRKYRININRKYNTDDLCNKLNFGLEEEGFIYLGNKKLSEVYSETSDTYNYLKELKNDLFNKGILSFHDAYVLAYKFLNKFPETRDLISARFRYLFIDEMQDTSSLQIELLYRVFDKEQVSIQCIGDENQAIFENSSGKLRWKPKNPLSLAESKRFSSSIADCVDKVCVKPQNIKGNLNINNIPPIILVFNDSNIENVLPTFSKIIIDNNLHNEDRKIFKAVGRVAKVHNEGHITIPSYFTSYIKSSNEKIKKSYQSLGEYLKAISQFNDPNVRGCRKLLINCLLNTMRIENIRIDGKWYTERKLVEKLEEKNKILVVNLNRHIARWVIKVKNDEDISVEISKFIMQKFIPFFKGDKQISNELKEFCNKEIYETNESSCITKQINTITYQDENTNDEIIVSIDTVHNVKGETHTATLYLETYFKQYDLMRIREYLKKKHIIPKGKELPEALSIAYVGLTRPTHLLCLAMRQDTIDGNEEDLKNAGWQIKYL
ncbi:UvrD-helicase domain-containing protein [Niallia sp. 03133]|uniref:UvrD-helicase domain-containing protein n=1 Tax=Niallia sp. 03133 TaxID=3458060 RepID=UPI004043A596